MDQGTRGKTDPICQVSAFEDGSSVLLVHFTGTIPVAFRGRGLQIPYRVVDIVPYGYPKDAPLVYVPPTEQMSVRPRQHVSGEGRVYHRIESINLESSATSQSASETINVVRRPRSETSKQNL
jgi:hypothetical protein